MDHAHHSGMNHSSMAMDHSTMDHSTMDHSAMDHSAMDHSTQAMGGGSHHMMVRKHSWLGSYGLGANPYEQTRLYSR